MNIFKYIFPAAICLAIVSCEKELDFEYHDIEQQQVIEGLLSQEDVTVRLTKTVSTDEPFENNTIKDAIVIITDLTENIVHKLHHNGDGIFTNTDLSGVSGHEYELKVAIGTKTFTSISRMLTPSEIISAEFNWIKMPYDDVAVLKVQFTANDDSRTNYWLRIYRNGMIYEWQAIESRNAVDGIVTGMLLTSRKDIEQEDEDEVLRDGDVVDIEVMPISHKMSDYLNSLNNGDYNGNQMFSGEYCLGYFLAAPTSKVQIIYHPDQIPYTK